MNESDIERAENHQQWLMQKQIERQRAQVPEGVGPEECDCSNPIPKKRREMGYHTCVACAETRERKDAMLKR